MAATALLLPSLAAPTATQRRTHSSLQPQLQLQRGSLACCSRSLRPPRRRPRLAVPAVQETKEGEAKTAEEITEKYGLEFGLWKVSGGHRGVQLQGRGGRRRGEEVADGPGQGAPGQVRRRVPGHLHLALHRLLHPLLPPHQRRRRRAGAARQGRDRDGRNRREGRDLRVGLRRAQGRVADQVPADSGADAGGGQLDW